MSKESLNALDSPTRNNMPSNCPHNLFVRNWFEAESELCNLVSITTVDKCANYCSNDGKCSIVSGSPVCSCIGGYNGDTCQCMSIAITFINLYHHHFTSSAACYHDNIRVVFWLIYSFASLKLPPREASMLQVCRCRKTWPTPPLTMSSICNPFSFEHLTQCKKFLTLSNIDR